MEASSSALLRYQLLPSWMELQVSKFTHHKYLLYNYHKDSVQHCWISLMVHLTLLRTLKPLVALLLYRYQVTRALTPRVSMLCRSLTPSMYWDCHCKCGACPSNLSGVRSIQSSISLHVKQCNIQHSIKWTMQGMIETFWIMCVVHVHEVQRIFFKNWLCHSSFSVA